MAQRISFGIGKYVLLSPKISIVAQPSNIELGIPEHCQQTVLLGSLKPSEGGPGRTCLFRKKSDALRSARKAHTKQNLSVAAAEEF